MSTYHQLYDQSQNVGDLYQRATYAIGKYAAYVLQNSGDSTLLAWARKAILDPSSYVRIMIFAIISDANYGNASPDNDVGDSALQSLIEFLINNTFKNF